MEIKYNTHLKGDMVINKKILSVNQGKVTFDFQPVIHNHTKQSCQQKRFKLQRTSNCHNTQRLTVQTVNKNYK